jgi:hypothetical protein
MTDYIDPTKERFARFREMQRGGPIHMLNPVRLRARASYPDGRDVSGADAYRESGEVVQGRFETTLIGPDSERWDRVFIAEYPSVDGFGR